MGVGDQGSGFHIALLVGTAGVDDQIAGLLLLTIGLLLLRRGWWPRRRGKEPACGSCGYSAVANKSGTCPECGRVLSGSNLVFGQRQRRNSLGLAGLLACIFALACFFDSVSPALRSIDLYQYEPHSWVIKDAASLDPTLSARGWAELLRRRGARSLSASADARFMNLALAQATSVNSPTADFAWQSLNRWRVDKTLPESTEQALITSALAEQAKPRQSRGPLHAEMVEYLSDRWADGKLTAPQAQRFFDQAMVASMRVRSVVSLGQVVPIEFSWGSDDAPLRDWSYRLHQIGGVFLDGKQQDDRRDNSSGMGFGGGSLTSTVPVDSAGPHTVGVKLRYELIHAPYSQNDQTPAACTHEITLEAQTLVVRRQAVEDVKLLDRPELADTLRSRIHPHAVYWPAPGDGPVQFNLSVDRAPINIAFDVFLRRGQKLYSAGTVALAKGRSMEFGLSCPELRGDAAEVDLILSSSPETARRSVDLTEIWNGTIVLPRIWSPPTTHSSPN